MRQNIVLIGFMGSGKTSVGKLLSQRLQYGFWDTDDMIEKYEKRKIKDIFAEQGEEFFRDLETKTAEAMVDTAEKEVISTGGGLPMRECNGEILKRLGFVVYLQVSCETVVKRLHQDKSRPLLAGEDRMEKIESLLSYRQPMYEAVAHLTVKTDEKDMDEIVCEIIRNYKMMINYGNEQEEIQHGF